MDELNEQAQTTFKALISRYSEDTYFYLVRNYLGLVSSPFHKPQLTARLCQFFCQKDIQDRMISLLDTFDVTLLSLLSITGPLSSEQVTDLLKSSYRYGDLIRRVANLQERLILLSDDGLLLFNPLIEDRLLDLCSLKPLLGESEKTRIHFPYCSGEFLRAFLSMVAKEGKLPYREELASHFPAYDNKRLEILYRTLGEVLTKFCIISSDKTLTINYEKTHALFELDDCTLLSLLIAQDGEHLGFARELLSYLQEIGSCDTNSLKLLIRMLSFKHHVHYDANLITTLSTWAVITLDDIWYVNSFSTERSCTALVIDSDQTISYEGTLPSNDILYRFAELEVLDHQRRYRVTKESFLAALDAGLTFGEIATYLRNNSKNGMGSLLLKQLEMLDQQYHNIAIYDALVLSCDERTANLVHNLPSLAGHMRMALSPTIFLMRRDTEAQWRQALVQAGQLMGATKSFEHIEVRPHQDNPQFFSLLAQAKTLRKVPTITAKGIQKEAFFDEELKHSIDQTPLTAAQRMDVEHRFQARMILVPSQIVGQILNTVMEAGGFDYQGKVSLCRQAAGKKDVVLQLQLTDQELVVQALEVAYTAQKEALLKGAVMPSMEVKILPISKIFLIRLVRFHLA